MNWKDKAASAPYFLATSMKECPLDRFWVVQLDCGIEIYQSTQYVDVLNPWLRLKKFCEDNKIKIVNMAFATREMDIENQVNLDPNADGYFYTQRCRALLTGFEPLAGYADEAQGIGELHGNILTIHWYFTDGRRDTEARDLSLYEKSKEPLSLIRR